MNRTIFDKIGLPKPLAWAYLGILIFMMGDGIEQGWLSPYLIGRGLSLEQSAGLFTMYGVTIAISAWFSGVLAEAYGVKRTMFAGLVLYLLGTCGFVGLSLPGLHYPLMLATYALRGFGYPLFAYSFLVWIAYAAPKKGRRRVLARIYRRTQRPRGLLFQLGHRAHRQYQYAVDIRILGFAGGVFRLGDEQVAETACRCGRYP